MKIIGINASPRKGANTQTLVEAVLKGAENQGAETRLVNLRELKLNGCLGCEGCKAQLGHCVQRDDLTPLLRDLTVFDTIVLGMPVYWFHVTAQFKMLVDRFYCYLEEGTDPDTGQPRFRFEFPGGKTFILILSRGDVEPPSMFPQFYDHLNEWLNVIPLSLGAGRIEYLNHYGSESDRHSAAKDTALIEKAESLGRTAATGQ